MNNTCFFSRWRNESEPQKVMNNVILSTRLFLHWTISTLVEVEAENIAADSFEQAGMGID